jgi:catechol 2,3-dioxygenase-like lactoylglutathione lyase family enzyme
LEHGVRGGSGSSLSRYKVAAALAVSDMNRARDFYEDKLSLSASIDSGENLQYRCAEGSVIHVYLSPEHAGKATATLAGWASTTSRGS